MTTQLTTAGLTPLGDTPRPATFVTSPTGSLTTAEQDFLLKAVDKLVSTALGCPVKELKTLQAPSSITLAQICRMWALVWNGIMAFHFMKGRAVSGLSVVAATWTRVAEYLLLAFVDQINGMLPQKLSRNPWKTFFRAFALLSGERFRDQVRDSATNMTLLQYVSYPRLLFQFRHYLFQREQGLAMDHPAMDLNDQSLATLTLEMLAPSSTTTLAEQLISSDLRSAATNSALSLSQLLWETSALKSVTTLTGASQ